MIKISQKKAIVLDAMMTLLFLCMFSIGLLLIPRKQSSQTATESQNHIFQENFAFVDDLNSGICDLDTVTCKAFQIQEESGIVKDNAVYVDRNFHKVIKKNQQVVDDNQTYVLENPQVVDEYQTNAVENPQTENTKSDFNPNPQLLSNQTYQNITEREPENFFYYSFGVSPVVFYGNNFVTNYFSQNKSVFAPTISVGYLIPKNKIAWGINCQGTISEFSVTQKNYFFNNPISLSSLFFSTQINLSLMHYLFSASNLIDYHFGLGITGFANNKCSLSSSYNEKTSLNVTAATGLSFRHFFGNHYFAGFLMDINWILGRNKMVYFQPALLSGFRF